MSRINLNPSTLHIFRCRADSPLQPLLCHPPLSGTISLPVNGRFTPRSPAPFDNPPLHPFSN